MKLTESHYRGVAIACGALLIGMGVLRGAFHVELGEKLEKWLADGLFIVAALAFLQIFALRRKRRQESGKP
ncbi:MAG TPA: hypothetical protein VFG59_06875 [Anaeromyxobacter sp.]|nr:hypothetical protein [Anaeromyxobacter sp.]